MLPTENTATRTFIGECILRTTVSTTGFCGDESESGSHTRVVFEDMGVIYEDSAFDAEVTDGNKQSTDRRVKKRIAIDLAGDAELKTFINALRFSADALEALAKASEDDPMCD